MIRRKNSIRLNGWNYSNPGYYFVTIYTNDLIECFGNIKNEKIFLNTYGNIVQKQWIWLSTQYKYIKLDTYIIMPNHLHGILIIDYVNPVGTGRDLSLQGIKIKSLSEIIGAFKTTSSKIIHLNGFSGFQWQRSFYDHIIRNENELYRIRKYIINNPLKWEFDRNNF